MRLFHRPAKCKAAFWLTVRDGATKAIVYRRRCDNQQEAEDLTKTARQCLKGYIIRIAAVPLEA